MKKITKKILKYSVIFEVAEEGGYIVSVPALDNLTTQGETFEEAISNVKDAILGVLSVMREESIKIPIEKSERIFSKVAIDYPYAIA